MSGPLAGKVALITGASQGIGRSIAFSLAQDGAQVVVNYNSNAAKADEVVTRIGADKATAIQADVSKLADSKSLIDQTVQKYGRIDILVLNAGLTQQNGSLAETTEEDFDRLYGTNVKAPYFLTQQAVKHIPDGGRVLFFSTSLTQWSNLTPNYLLYVSTKGAVEQMTRVLAKDLGRRQITVNCIAPGPTATQAFYTGKTDELVKHIAAGNPQNRIGKPEEIADVVKMVVSPASQWMNGNIIRVNGGMTVGV